ncbi:MAG TPA: 6-phosphogluconolactonase [Terriglobales bacterium]|nr:6-phosphogluconolactonase [Terriglobales bacterium]
MRVEILADANAVAKRAAEFIAAEAFAAVGERGLFTLAVSGGHTPWIMLRALATKDIPWKSIQIFRVAERSAPAGDPERNLTQLREILMERAPLPTENLHAMPVESTDPVGAAREYSAMLRQIAGGPAVLDLVHLGTGPDGHTASLVPGDPVLRVTDEDVALTSLCLGRRRMTLTFPMINRARRVLAGHRQGEGSAPRPVARWRQVHTCGMRAAGNRSAHRGYSGGGLRAATVAFEGKGFSRIANTRTRDSKEQRCV